MISKLTDKEIIDSIKNGNRQDFRILVDRYKNRAFSMLKRMLKNDSDAEEVLQDSFVKAFNSLPSFRSDAKFSTWFYKIVYNTCLTALTKQKREQELSFVSIDESYDIGSYDTNIINSIENPTAILYGLINSLPIRYSLILILFYIDELSINEISAVLNLTGSNVKVLLHRARTELKEILIKNNFRPEDN